MEINYRVKVWTEHLCIDISNWAKIYTDIHKQENKNFHKSWEITMITNILHMGMLSVVGCQLWLNCYFLIVAVKYELVGVVNCDLDYESIYVAN